MMISRRGFLGMSGLAMIGCDMKKNGPSTPPGRPVANADASSTIDGGGTSRSLERVAPNRTASPLAAAPGVLARLEASALALYETRGFSVLARIELERPFGVGFLGDGSIVALAHHEGKPAVFHVAKGATKANRHGSAITRGEGRARVFPAADASHFLVVAPSSHYSLFEYRFDGDAVRAVGYVDDLSPADHETMIPWHAGVLFQRWASLVAARVGSEPVRYQAANLSAAHLAPGPGGQVWASDGSAIHLLELVDPVADKKRIDAGALVYHLDGDAAGAAAILVEPVAPESARWWLAAWDATGREQWRVDLPPLVPPDAASRFVRLVDTAVVLEDGTGITAWSRADGTRR